MKKNGNLTAAKRNKNDEFYTRLCDIEREMVHYKPYFNGKVVYCNCDNPKESNFFRYFVDNFKELGLKKVVATGFIKDGFGCYGEYSGDEVVYRTLDGNGDFRNDECIEFLKEADVVVTNPPFSLFREYIGKLFEYDKKFLIIGNNNAISYKEVFPYIKNNQLWLGVNSNKMMDFVLGDDYVKWDRIEDGKKIGKVPAVSWFTNLQHNKRNLTLDLYKNYTPADFPKYDNYDAIEVSKVSDIPMDYDGVMGVPITFLNKYCPEQFEIVGITENNTKNKHLHILGCEKYDRPYLNGERKYSRILIKYKR